MQIVESVFPQSNFASAQKNLVRVYQGARVSAKSEEFSQLNPSCFFAMLSCIPGYICGT